MNIVDSFGNPVAVGSDLVSWNATNNYAFNPPQPGGPSSEAHLAAGWAIEAAVVGGGGSLLYFFASSLSDDGTSPGGSFYTNPSAPVDVFFLIRFGGSIGTTPAGTSAVTVNVDGVTTGFDDTGGTFAPWSGSISMQPKLWWEYRKSDGTNPIYDATTGAVLLPGRQTDELF